MKSDGEIFVYPEQMIDSSKVKEAIISIVTPDEYLTAFTKEHVEKPKRVRKQLVIDSSEKSSSSPIASFEIPIDKKKRKTKKVIVKKNNATKNAR